MSVSETVSLVGAVQVTDNQTGSITGSFAVNQSFAGSFSAYYPSFSVASGGGTSVTLPVSPVQFAFFKNTGAVAVSITWTKNGGSSAGVLTLDPGAYQNFGETTTSNGITALTLTAASSTGTVQMLLAG